MSRPVKSVPMAWVQIGNMTQLLMPADDGMKLVKLLQTATECQYEYIDRGHGHDFVYVLKGRALNVEFKLVQPNQIHSATPADKSRRPGTLLLENAP
jgi:hypothetical protein